MEVSYGVIYKTKLITLTEAVKSPDKLLANSQ